jgi:hypothetical protein
MTDRKDDGDLSALEAEVEAARAQLSDSLQNLTRPSISEAVKHDIRSYAETVKEQVVEKISTTRSQLVSNAREASRRQVHSLTDSLRERAAANPLALILIGAGIGWRLYHRPPIATLLVGAGAASLFMNSSRRAARHFDEYHNPYRSDHPGGYVPGGVAGYGYPVEERAPRPSLRERAESLGETVEQGAGAARAKASDLAFVASEKASDIAAAVSDKAGDLAAQVTDKASQLAARVSDAAQSGRARVADTASAALETASATAGQIGERASATVRGVRREVGHYGEAARRELSGNAGRYGMLLGAIGLSLAAVAFGATQVAAGRKSGSAARSAAGARPKRGTSGTGSDNGSFGTSEDAFIAKLRDSNPTDPSFVESSAIATEDIVGDTEPATRGGEVPEGKETEAANKPRGRKRIGSGE